MPIFVIYLNVILIISKGVNDHCLAPNEQIFSYIVREQVTWGDNTIVICKETCIFKSVMDFVSLLINDRSKKVKFFGVSVDSASSSNFYRNVIKSNLF
jgi:hypothetical protein